MRKEKKIYKKPVIERIKIDNTTSLVMASLSPDDPFDPNGPWGAPPAGSKSDNSKEHPDIDHINSFENNPFK